MFSFIYFKKWENDSGDCMLYRDRLKEIREDKEAKQKILANLLGIRENAYCQYETEYVIIPIKYLNILANYFQVSFDYLFGFVTNRSYIISNNDINKDLMRERLRELRKEYKLSQKELAYAINVAPSTISDYERKAKVIATPFLYDICRKYKYSADYLLGKINEPKYIK